MVSTRHHPRPFPEPTLPPSRSPGKDTNTSTSSSPTKTSPPPSPTVDIPLVKRTPARRSTRKSVVEATTEEPTPTTTTALKRTRSKRKLRSQSASTYVHHPDSVVVAWLLVSLPLVVWDTLYVFGRPHTMPGGRWHSPFWTPYALYGTADYMYGWPQWDRNNGFTAAQASLNAVETAMYVYYLYIVFVGAADGWKKGVIEKLFRQQTKGRIASESPYAALAVAVCWASAVMTLSKTILYWLNEAFSGFENIGHNTVGNLILLWIIPNGFWIVVPTYAIYVLGKEIVSAMSLAGESPNKEE